jgi:hypothetical protein
MEARILKHDKIVDATGPLPAATRPAAPSTHAKRARLVEVDGVVRAIECTCSCGETTLLELEYPSDARKPSTK